MTNDHGGRRDNHKRRPDDARGGYRGAFRLVRTVRLTPARAVQLRDALRAQGITPTRAAVSAEVERRLAAYLDAKQQE